MMTNPFATATGHNRNRPYHHRSSRTITSRTADEDLTDVPLDAANDDHLEVLAAAFQQRLQDVGAITGHKAPYFGRWLPTRIVSKTIPKSFTGRDAVNILQELLHEEQMNDESITHVRRVQPPPSRSEALEVGRAMAFEFSFFVPTNSKNNSRTMFLLLEDDAKAIYQFHDNLPSCVRAVKHQHPTYWDKMRLFEDALLRQNKIQDRRHMFRLFPSCFVAREAVDVLMQLQLVKSRREAVWLVQQLNQHVHCCQHVCSEHDFSDDYFFFRLVPACERMPDPYNIDTSSHSIFSRTQEHHHHKTGIKHKKSPALAATAPVSTVTTTTKHKAKKSTKMMMMTRKKSSSLLGVDPASMPLPFVVLEPPTPTMNNAAGTTTKKEKHSSPPPRKPESDKEEPTVPTPPMTPEKEEDSTMTAATTAKATNTATPRARRGSEARTVKTTTSSHDIKKDATTKDSHVVTASSPFTTTSPIRKTTDPAIRARQVRTGLHEYLHHKQQQQQKRRASGASHDEWGIFTVSSFFSGECE